MCYEEEDTCVSRACVCHVQPVSPLRMCWKHRAKQGAQQATSAAAAAAAGTAAFDQQCATAHTK